MQGRRLAAILAVTALVLLDIALVTLAVRAGTSRAAEASGGADAGATLPGTTAGPGVMGATESPLSDASSRLLLLGAAGDVALRGVPGACAAGGAALERSSDGGRTWVRISVPATALARAEVVGERLSVVGYDGTCAAHTFESTDQGMSWQQVGEPEWQVLPENRLRTPDGDQNSPCNRTLDLDPIADKVAALLCGSGSVYVSTESGTWNRREGVSGGLALDFVDPQVGWVVATVERCRDGVEVLGTTDGGITWQERACVEVPRDVAVGLAFQDESAGLLVAGTTTYATKDGGRSWATTS